MKQCNFQNNYGVIAYRKVCSCAPYSTFSVDPQNFLLGANLYEKCDFSRFLRLQAHMIKIRTVKFGIRMRIWDSLIQAKFYFFKSLKGVYPFWENLYQKLPIIAILEPVSRHF